MRTDYHDKMMSQITQRLDQLESKLGKSEITLGRDPMDYSKREAFSILLGCNLSEAETEALDADPKTWVRLRRRLVSAEAFLDAAHGGGDIVTAHNAGVELRIADLIWLRGWRKRLRSTEAARIRAHYQKPLSPDLWGE